MMAWWRQVWRARWPATDRGARQWQGNQYRSGWDEHMDISRSHRACKSAYWHEQVHCEDRFRNKRRAPLKVMGEVTARHVHAY